jgi:NADPH:quinone reductase-like Zn-dependent oxidoreductase
MRAIIQVAYGSPGEVLGLRDIDEPAVEGGEVLVEVHASAVAGDDWHLLQGQPYTARLATGLRRPKQQVPGRDVAGRVGAVGASVVGLRPGDEVFGWCDGAFAEWVAVPAGQLAHRPANLTLEQAAVVPTSGCAALRAVRDVGSVELGQHVLVIGASGGVGTFAIQIAKALGATVTGICSTTNTDLVRSIGADHVIDYTLEDLSADTGRYDVIIDLVGIRSPSDLRRSLDPRGTLVLMGGTGGRWFKGTRRPQRVRPLSRGDRTSDLETLRDLIEAGRVTPVVSAHYPLAEVPDALRHFAQGHARGKVAITI